MLSRYECDVYECVKEQFPEIGSCVVTPEGDGYYCEVNTVKKSANVKLKDSGRSEFALGD